MTRELPREVWIGEIPIGSKHPLVLIAGPCVIEDESKTRKIAEGLKKITEKMELPLIFKSSYDKANRSNLSSFRGPGVGKGLEILSQIKRDLNIPVLSDVHSLPEAEEAASVLDVLQIPALLCRQTKNVQ